MRQRRLTGPGRGAPALWLGALFALFALAMGGAALAVEPGEMLDDPALEAEARAISKELRCVVCDNASIDDSNAEIAKTMRTLVRQRLVEGRSAEEIKAEFVDYYGEFVLFRPQLSWSNLLIWAATPLALAYGLLLAWRRFRPRRGAAMEQTLDPDAAPTAPALSEEERRRLDELLKD
ncbi:MAG: cytochrome c-type biogenesis protein [Pseudomonadota bacterium]